MFVLILTWLPFWLCLVNIIIYEDPKDVSVVAPNRVTLRCQADGQPTPEIVWIKNGDDQFTLTANNVIIDETTDGMNKTSTLTIEPSSPQDTGTYRCRAQNMLSIMTSSEAQVNVFSEYSLSCLVVHLHVYHN